MLGDRWISEKQQLYFAFFSFSNFISHTLSNVKKTVRAAVSLYFMTDVFIDIHLYVYFC